MLANGMATGGAGGRRRGGIASFYRKTTFSGCECDPASIVHVMILDICTC